MGFPDCRALAKVEPGGLSGKTVFKILATWRGLCHARDPVKGRDDTAVCDAVTHTASVTCPGEACRVQNVTSGSNEHISEFVVRPVRAGPLTIVVTLTPTKGKPATIEMGPYNILEPPVADEPSE